MIKRVSVFPWRSVPMALSNILERDNVASDFNPDRPISVGHALRMKQRQ